MKLSLLLSIAGVWGIVLVGLVIRHYQNDVVIVKDFQNLKYQRVRFNTDGATKASFIQFIEDLLEALQRGDAHGIPTLAQATDVNDRTNRFVEVELTNGQHTITLAIEVTNIYVWGYNAGRRSFFTQDAPSQVSYLFPNTAHERLGFTSNYESLKKYAKQSRENIPLGIEQMAAAITALHNVPNRGDDQKPHARAFIILIQMIAEAVRFRPIKQLITASIEDDGNHDAFCPTAYMLSLENEWTALSEQVQRANIMTLIFQRAVQLEIENQVYFFVSAVHHILFELAIMKFICLPPKPPRLLQQGEAQALLIPTISEEVGNYCWNTASEWQGIRGFNGKCAVPDANFVSGYPVELRDCNGSYSHNWGFKRDGTIRDEDGHMCLATTGYTRGSSIVTQSCDRAARNAITWEVLSNGNIVNPSSGYVLTVDSGDIGTPLKLDENSYRSKQSWSVGTEIDIPERFIIGLNDLCLYTDGNGVWLVKCNSGHAHKWALFPDGTIRTQQNQKQCLFARETDHLVITTSCSGSYNERWVFENNGNIKNLHHDRVLDVKESDPSLKQIIIFPSKGNPNQIWYTSP